MQVYSIAIKIQIIVKLAYRGFISVFFFSFPMKFYNFAIGLGDSCPRHIALQSPPQVKEQIINIETVPIRAQTSHI